VLMDVDPGSSREFGSVPMALGKHLFPYRTQQLSPAAVTILGYSPGKIARCRII
jgi:nucleoside 2-deoxyribosyltransferase